MVKFIKEALQEIEHVVWPTRAETKKYFTIVVSMIVVTTAVLFVFSSGVTTALFAIRSVTPHEEAVTIPTTDTRTESLLDQLKTLSGSATVSGSATPVSIEEVTSDNK